AGILLPVVVLVVALVAPAGAWSNEAASAALSVENGGPWGDWGDPEFCPKGSFATGFQLKVGTSQGVGDLAGVWGHVGGDDTRGQGTWLPPLSCSRGRLSAFRLRVEAPRGLWDDTAANNLDMACSDGAVLEGQGGNRGTWGNWSSFCPPGGGVCGLRTRLEGPQRKARDDTALNDLDFFCCN
ncbi:VMO1 protein, partial [Piaya cayana]|nr:VMO1 protein [Piaya cayana]